MIPGGLSSLWLASEKPASVAWTASPGAPASAPASPYSETGVSIGTAANDRYVIVCLTTVSASNIQITGVTVAGTSCTLLARCPATVLGDCCMWITNSPITSGTTATISATYGSTPTYVSMEVFAVTGLKSSTPSATASIGDGSSTAAAVALGTLTIPANGFFLGYVGGWPNVSSSYTWSGTMGAAESSDNNPDGNNDIRQTSAILNSISGVTGTATATLSTTFTAGRRGGAAVCMR